MNDKNNIMVGLGDNPGECSCDNFIAYLCDKKSVVIDKKEQQIVVLNFIDNQKFELIFSFDTELFYKVLQKYNQAKNNIKKGDEK